MRTKKVKLVVGTIDNVEVGRMTAKAFKKKYMKDCR
jgi:hypothetical protein